MALAEVTLLPFKIIQSGVKRIYKKNGIEGIKTRFHAANRANPSRAHFRSIDLGVVFECGFEKGENRGTVHYGGNRKNIGIAAGEF